MRDSVITLFSSAGQMAHFHDSETFNRSLKLTYPFKVILENLNSDKKQRIFIGRIMVPLNSVEDFSGFSFLVVFKFSLKRGGGGASGDSRPLYENQDE